MVMAGSGDKLMTPPIMIRLANWFRDVVGKDEEIEQQEETGELDDTKEGLDSVGRGVECVFVQGPGHHVQNDVQWKDGARKLLGFYEKLKE